MAGYEPRIEDERLLKGTGRFIDDERRAGEAYGVFVRSPHAHAAIRAIDTDAARAAPGVLAILTAGDLAAAGVGTIALLAPVPGGAGLVAPHRPSLAGDIVRHVGEAVALVVADGEAAARDAADRVVVRYDERPAVTDLDRALLPQAPLLWPAAPGNVALDWEPGGAGAAGRAELDRLFARAAHVARARLVNQRIVMAPMEPRGALATHDPDSGRFTLHCPSQSAYVLQQHVAHAMGVAPSLVRILSGDVGGAFGMRTSGYPEYPALLVAARQTGRPVRWLATRSEGFLSDNQGRDTVIEAALALDADGRFLALDIDVLANMGAYLSSHGPFIATVNFSRCLPGMYDIRHLALRMRCLFTNTVPTGPYRGAGRPEANYMLERLIDEAARVAGIDRVALRRRNLIAPAMMPYATPVGTRYDSGDFPGILDAALAEADVAGFARRRARSQAAGRLRGLGLSCFLEIAGGQPGEGADIGFPGGSRLLLAIGVHATGQGFATVYRRLVAARLGIPAHAVEVAMGDSDAGVKSAGAVASRSTMSVGGAVAATLDALLAKGKEIAAQVLEAAEADILYKDGVFEIAGTDRRIGLFELAERAAELKRQGVIAEDLATARTIDAAPSFPNGCHLAEIEIDPDTGHAQLCAYTAVDDCGVVLQPVLVEGQVQGGVAQGAGQALLEAGIYDDDSGQLLAGSFMDYAMPRAADLPMIASAHRGVPCLTNALGVKGVGEAGTTAALAAIMSAVADALPPEARIDMPATPARIWQALQTTRSPGGA